MIPNVCIIDDKPHIRTFLGDAFEELGFLVSTLGGARDLEALLAPHYADIVVLGLSAGGVEASRVIEALAARSFSGQLLVIGQAGSPMVAAVRHLAGQRGLALLPTLATPFSIDTLHRSVAELLSREAPPNAPVDVAEALKSGWLELWYQHKVDARTLASRGAEALVRMRHPSWGVVPPAYFIPDHGDPHFHQLSEFVLGQALDDWHYFLVQAYPIELAINLPVSFLEDPDAIDALCRRMPRHPAFGGLTIEINGTEILRNLALLIDVTRRVRFHNIAVAIDDIGAEWPSFIGLDDFPFAEIKVDRKFIQGCADDRLKRSVCRSIIEMASGYGARTVAEGVETRADMVTARELGFNQVQGFLFGRPAARQKFVRTSLSRPLAAPG
jgi:EAL domain-containing protein (putative c-di-GMP-specific phosphodiesterase class I)